MLILDDATASIDPETEEMIRKGMHLVMHGRTTFVIAHRISTVKKADLVLVDREWPHHPVRHACRTDGNRRPLSRDRRGSVVSATNMPQSSLDRHPSHMRRMLDKHEATAGTRGGNGGSA